jgi:diacylglycerol O-acyltransferase / wax synthase
MTSPQQSERLSWGDALFLYLERAGMPLNIACVSIFEGEISLEDCIRAIESKLPLLPRYYQRVVVPPLNIGFPSWEYDPNFDIHNHITEFRLKHGTEAELKTLSGKILSTVMDRRRPLWDFTLVSGLRHNRTAVITRIHHCLADGIAGIGVMSVIMDATSTPPPLTRKNPPRAPRRQNDPWTQLLDGWLSGYSDLLGRALSTYSDLSTLTARVASTGHWPVSKLTRVLPELTAPTERLFFNVTYQGPQRFAFAKIPVAEIKAIRQRSGATFNDVVLALMTSTVARYSELHGDKVKGRLLRMMVPVNVRGCDSATQLGNRILLLPVTVPLGIRDPKRLLAAVSQRMEFLKNAHIAELFGLAGGMVGAVPAALQALVGPVASLLPITPFNMVCTNIRGPETPLYLAGHKMLDWYPYVPVGGEMALNCAILSYNGFAYFGFSGDVHAAPDLHRMEALLKESLAELTQMLGRKQPARHLKRKLKKRRPSPEPLTDVTPLQTVSKSRSTSTVSERPSPQHSITLTDEVLLAPVAAD